MKSMFTLMLLLGLMASAAAQPGVKHPGKFQPVPKPKGALTVSAGVSMGPMYTFTLRERNRAIAKVNRYYNRKIDREQHRIFVGRMEKERRIHRLRAQKDFEIRKINAKFYSPRNLWHRKVRHQRARW